MRRPCCLLAAVVGVLLIFSDISAAEKVGVLALSPGENFYPPLASHFALIDNFFSSCVEFKKVDRVAVFVFLDSAKGQATSPPITNALVATVFRQLFHPILKKRNYGSKFANFYFFTSDDQLTVLPNGKVSDQTNGAFTLQQLAVYLQVAQDLGDVVTACHTGFDLGEVPATLDKYFCSATNKWPAARSLLRKPDTALNALSPSAFLAALPDLSDGLLAQYYPEGTDFDQATKLFTNYLTRGPEGFTKELCRDCEIPNIRSPAECRDALMLTGELLGGSRWEGFVPPKISKKNGILALAGGFKPPHKGHYALMEYFFANCVDWEKMEKVYVMVFVIEGIRGSQKDHEMPITNAFSAAVYHDLFLPLLQERFGDKVAGLYTFDTPHRKQSVHSNGQFAGSSEAYTVMELAEALGLGPAESFSVGRNFGEYQTWAEGDVEKGGAHMCGAGLDVKWPEYTTLATWEPRDLSGGPSATAFRKAFITTPDERLGEIAEKFLPAGTDQEKAVEIFLNYLKDPQHYTHPDLLSFDDWFENGPVFKVKWAHIQKEREAREAAQKLKAAREEARLMLSPPAPQPANSNQRQRRGSALSALQSYFGLKSTQGKANGGGGGGGWW